MDASLTFVGSGATLGILLGSSLFVGRREGSSERRMLALLLVGISLAMLSIALQHGSVRFPGSRLLEFVEFVMALAAGPFLAGWVRSRARGVAPGGAQVLHLLPALAVGVAILLTGTPPVSMRLVMLVQMIYTAVASVEVIAARRRGGAETLIRWPARVTALMIAIHGAQVARTLFAGEPAVVNVVPLTAIAGLEVLAVLGLREAILSPAARTTVRARKPAAPEDAGPLLAAIDDAMRRDRLWTDPDLGLARLAEAAGSTPHRVSAALNVAHGGFAAYVAGWRLAEARAALEDPANDIYTIEALAGNAGFRSRSAFYASFRRRYGLTPSEVRRRPASPPAREASGLPTSSGPGT